MTPGSALHTRPEVRASRLVKMVPASRTRSLVHLPSLACPVPAQRYSAPSSANRGGRGTGQAPCYAVECTVSPVRVLSPVRYISAPHICRARLKIQPGRLVPALLSRSPVRLHSPVYPSPPPHTSPPVPALLSRSPVRLHGPVYPSPPPHTSPPVAAPRTRLPVRVLGLVPPVPAPRIRPTEPSSSPALPESPACPALLPESPACPALLPESPEPLSPEAPEPLSPEAPELPPLCPEQLHLCPELPLCPVESLRGVAMVREPRRRTMSY
ncbi:uncharacterized protein LOC135564610 [Oncorhynchus nerka]|uniref:uncharacterized protein LOC135564610 n=1 Tax=Oncorhynchus nerka TaxID=8023 RepID=UPI0031B89515